MKVLHLINSLQTGGAEKLLLDSLPIYNKQNIQADLALLYGCKTPFMEELEEQKCCQVIVLGNKSVYNPFLIFKIMPYFKKYDIIHAHLFPGLYWLALAKILSFNSCKIIYTEHNTSNRRRSKLLFKITDRLIYRRYDKVVTIAKEVDSNLKKHLNFDDSHFTMINNGINTKSYIDAKPYSKDIFFKPDAIIVIQVSSFRKQKDQPTLLRALSKLPERFKLLLVGDGELLNESKELVQQLNLEKRVLFLGNRMDIPKLLKTADIIVLSSHHEGLSLSSLEAMASGRPFIASDVPGLYEIVKGYGVLFKEGNDEELTKQILKLSEDKTYYHKIVKQCLFRANQFDINLMIKQYLNLYKSTLNKYN